MDNKTLGQQGEDIAAQYLKEKGYRILARNFRYKAFGELDIVAEKRGKIIFAEVKTLRLALLAQGKPFQPEDQITLKKEKQLRKMAQIFLSANHLPLDTPHQIDIIAVEIDGVGNVSDIRRHENAIEDAY